MQVSDGSLTASKAVAVTVTNVNEAPTVTSSASVSVAENTTAVQTVTATDPDAGTTLTYGINGGPDAALFSINSTTGALTFISAPDHEYPTDVGRDNIANVTVQASDGTNITTQAVTVTVTNVNEAPTGAVLISPNLLNDGSFETAGVPPGGVSGVSVIGGWYPVNRSTIEVWNNHAGRTGSNGSEWVELNNNGSSNTQGIYQDINTVNGATYSITFDHDKRIAAANEDVQVYWNGTLIGTTRATDTTHWITYTFTVTGTGGADRLMLLEDPLGDTGGTGTWVDNVSFTQTTASVPGKIPRTIATVATVRGIDHDAGDTLTYSLTNSANGRFAINASTGVITVADGSQLDYESATSHNITVRTTDAGGLTYDQVFTINVTNVNEAPTITSAATASVAENSTAVMTVTASDPGCRYDIYIQH